MDTKEVYGEENLNPQHLRATNYGFKISSITLGPSCSRAYNDNWNYPRANPRGFVFNNYVNCDPHPIYRSDDTNYNYGD